MQCSKIGRQAPLAVAVCLLFAAGQTQAQTEPKADKSLEKVVVTGTRVARTQTEGASGVTVIRAADLDRLGYRNVGDALAALTENTGFTQGEDFGNTFTPAANALSLRGLGPNKTLTLLNGRRVADYPRAYGGSVNFVNTANIPSALVDRIEVLSGGASAIYGSDAVAGVINIILKKQVEHTTLDLKLGTTQLGGGENARAQLSGGFDSGRLSAVWGLELSGREPIWSRQRGFMDDSTRLGANPTTVIGIKDSKSGSLWRLPAEQQCADAAGFFDGSVSRVDNKLGVYCGSGKASPAHWTIQSGNRSSNFASAAQFKLSEAHELFGEFLLGQTRTESNTRSASWTSESAGKGYFYNQNSKKNEIWTRRIAPEEYGGVERTNRAWEDSSYSLALGARGDLDFKDWSYELSVNHAHYRNQNFEPRFVAGVNEFFLGPQKGVDAKGVAIYAPDPARLFKPLNAEQFDQLMGETRADNRAWTSNINASVNGSLAQLSGGPLRGALTLEAGRQGFINESDPRLAQGQYYGLQEVKTVEGSRDRAAVGAELVAPLHKLLTATAALRYDHYRFADRKQGASTYNLGLEFRPTEQILLRASHATSFRAPDMVYLFADEVKGYYSSSTDHYRCARAGQPLNKCEFAGVAPGFNYLQTSGKELQPERGSSSGLGLVWEPVKDLDVSLDYWRVAIRDEVTKQDGDRLLRDEADCRLGLADAASSTCVDALARITRNPATAEVKPEAVTLVRVSPINASSKSTSGIDLKANYRFKTADWGDFQLGLKYNRVLTFVERKFPADEAVNKVGTHSYSGWPDKLETTASWRLNDWQYTLTGIRNGRISGAGDSWIEPKFQFNLSTSVQLNKASKLGLIVNNVANTLRKDEADSWPFYPSSYYTPYGRQFWLQYTHKFGV